MNKIIGTGIILMLAGCGLARPGVQTADPIAAGSDSPHRTDLQLSQDADYCHTTCLSA
jgi:hypothetical protein